MSAEAAWALGYLEEGKQPDAALVELLMARLDDGQTMPPEDARG